MIITMGCYDAALVLMMVLEYDREQQRRLVNIGLVMQVVELQQIRRPFMSAK
jgi:hypothetical protein|tara:strand:- start:103 stop:258 length:156 start_codon:yes stop_codon:yes gene_type:complete